MIEVVDFDTAKLLEEKGFNVECNKFYDEHGHLNESVNDFFVPRFEAPTIAQVVMWLYNKHGIWISVDKTFSDEFFFAITTNNEHNSKESKDFFNSPKEAYEAAIENVLKELI